MVNGMGRDRAGPLIIDQAIIRLPSRTGSKTVAVAWHNLLQDTGTRWAAAAGVPVVVRRLFGLDERPAKGRHGDVRGAC
jgi:hypothetical protein